MEISQLETFLAVISFGGFRKASSALRVSQPTVSARIKALEESLGVTLLVRRQSHLRLSPAGKVLRPHAEQLLTIVAKARQALHAQELESNAALHIAAALSICTYFLPDVLKEYHQANPKVALSVRSGKSGEVLKMVLDEEVDIGIVRSLNHPEVETTTLREDPLVLVSHPGHPAVKKRTISLKKAESLPLVFYDQGSSDWTLSQGLFRRAGLLPNVVLEVETIEAAKRMVERKLGLAFLPQIAVSDELHHGKLSAITITDCEPLRRNLDVIHLRRRPMTKEAHAFLLLLHTAASASRHFVRKQTKSSAATKKILSTQSLV